MGDLQNIKKRGEGKLKGNIGAYYNTFTYLVKGMGDTVTETR